MKPRFLTPSRAVAGAGVASLVGLFVLAVGCDVGRISRGDIRPSDVREGIDVGKKAGKKLAKAFNPKDLNPEQEHYLGRSVSARILGMYKVFDNPDANRYVNVLGQTVAKASDRPETFMGYRFLILDTDEVNAFAAPGGFVFVTRGLLKCCKSEAALAGALSHEVSHVQHKHGLKAIRPNKLVTVADVLTDVAAAATDNQKLGELAAALNGCVDDVLDPLVKSGYSRELEVEADETAVEIMKRLGYDPKGLVGLLQEMDQRSKSDRKGFFSSHPAPGDRTKWVEEKSRGAEGKPASPEREERFKKAMANP